MTSSLLPPSSPVPRGRASHTSPLPRTASFAGWEKEESLDLWFTADRYLAHLPNARYKDHHEGCSNRGRVQWSHLHQNLFGRSFRARVFRTRRRHRRTMAFQGERKPQFCVQIYGHQHQQGDDVLLRFPHTKGVSSVYASHSNHAVLPHVRQAV